MILYDVLSNEDGTLKRPERCYGEGHHLSSCIILKVGEDLSSAYIARKKVTERSECLDCVWEIDPPNKCFIHYDIVSSEVLMDWLKINYPTDFEFLIWNLELFNGKYNGG